MGSTLSGEPPNDPGSGGPAHGTHGLHRSVMAGFSAGHGWAMPLSAVRLMVSIPTHECSIGFAFKKKLQRRRFDMSITKHHVAHPRCRVRMFPSPVNISNRLLLQPARCQLVHVTDFSTVGRVTIPRQQKSRDCALRQVRTMSGCVKSGNLTTYENTSCGWFNIRHERVLCDRSNPNQC